VGRTIKLALKVGRELKKVGKHCCRGMKNICGNLRCKKSKYEKSYQVAKWMIYEDIYISFCTRRIYTYICPSAPKLLREVQRNNTHCLHCLLKLLRDINISYRNIKRISVQLTEACGWKQNAVSCDDLPGNTQVINDWNCQVCAKRTVQRTVFIRL